MRRTVMLGLVVGALLTSAPLASATQWKQDPAADACQAGPAVDRYQCFLDIQKARNPAPQQGTGGPAHNICVLTGHAC
jgi:hypothetical protein